MQTKRAKFSEWNSHFFIVLIKTLQLKQRQKPIRVGKIAEFEKQQQQQKRT